MRSYRARAYYWIAVAITFLGSPEAVAPAYAQTPASQPSPLPADLEAERQQLEAQRKQIDQRLAEIEAIRQGRATPQQPAPTARQPGGDQPAHPGVDVTPPSQPIVQKDQTYSVHGQATVITQKHDAFPAPYTGPLSLPRHEGEATSMTGTLFLGTRVWNGGEVYFNPEIAGGEGLGGVTGIAGFPNGEIPRVGTPEPRPYIARLFLRQTFGFGDDREFVDDGPNQIAGFRKTKRITLTIGKFGAVDLFQNNAYTNDPRTQFENWALFTTGAWDYPADTRGYTQGAVIEYAEPSWALRYGAMTEPTAANGGTFDSHIPEALGHALEFEKHYEIAKYPGVLRLLGFANSAHMGKYREAIDRAAATGSIPDVTQTRAYRIKYGFALSAEQELAEGLGLFARLGMNDGRTESWAFTEIDQTAALGLSLKGSRWHRPNDVIGLAGVVNGLSPAHRAYLAAGGHGFIIGDGQLHYGLEKIAEGYYMLKLTDHVFLTGDLQYIFNPAYNRDRGPVFVIGARAHIEF